jgi:phasin
MRAFAEKSVAQAKQAFDGFIDAARKAAEQAQDTATTAQSGARDVAQLAMSFAQRNIASSFDFAQKLVHAKDPRDVMNLHADYVKQQMDVLGEQAKELGQRTAKMAGGKN